MNTSPARKTVLPALLRHRSKTHTENTHSTSNSNSGSTNNISRPNSSNNDCNPNFECGTINNRRDPNFECGTINDNPLMASPPRHKLKKSKRTSMPVGKLDISPRRYAEIRSVDDIVLYEKISESMPSCIYRAVHGAYTIVCKTIDVTNYNESDKEELRMLLKCISEYANHPNIVHYFGADTTSDTRHYHLMMEYFPMTLHDWITKKRAHFFANNVEMFTSDDAKLSIAGLHSAFSEDYMETVRIFGLQIAQAIAYLHTTIIGAGTIIHRDIKSENVFMHWQPDKENESVLKLGDFETAKLVVPKKHDKEFVFAVRNSIKDDADAMSYLKRKQRSPKRWSMNRGTAQFMAPEIIYDHSFFGYTRESYGDPVSYTHKVDVWSLGLVLFEMIAMEHPYARENLKLLDMVSHISRGKRPEWPSFILLMRDRKDDAEVSRVECLVTISEKMTEKNVQDRPTSTEVMKMFQK